MSVHEAVKNNPVIAIPLTAVVTFLMTVALHWGSDRVHIEQTETASRIQIESIQKRIDSLATKEEVQDLYVGLSSRIDDLREDLRAPVSRNRSSSRSHPAASPETMLKAAALPQPKRHPSIGSVAKWVPVHGGRFIRKVFAAHSPPETDDVQP